MVTVREAKAEYARIEALGKKPLVVVGIPAYNEERTIAKVVLEAQKHADIVLVCDDGSSDYTGEIAERLGATVERHEENKGDGAAIQSMFKAARKLGADIFVTLDGDGQHEADQIPQLIQPVLDGKADVVTGSRFLGNVQNNGSNRPPWHRRLGIRAITRLTTSTSKCSVTDAQNGFRAYGKKALEKLSLSENGMGVSVEVLLKSKEEGLQLAEVPVECNYDGVEKPSSHNPIRHGASVVSSLVKLIVEERPLILLGIPGIISLAIGVFFGVWMLRIYAVEHQIMTNVALASIAFILIGFFALSTAITLYAILRLAEKTSKAEK